MQVAAQDITPIEDAPPPGIILKKFSAKHKQAMALVAQGVDRQTIAKICRITPEYVSWLQRQPACKEYLAEMSEVVGVRLEALFEKSVEVIADTMINGKDEDRLKAARLQLEATKRLGKHEVTPDMPGTDRLEKLAGRLTGLLSKVRAGETLEGSATDITDVEVIQHGEDANV